MKIEVNTESKNVLYKQGKYPVGHIKLVVADYVRRAEWFDQLAQNMKNRILELEDEATDNKEFSECPDKHILVDKINVSIDELKYQLKLVNAWWEPSMEDTSRLHTPETDFHLRQYGADKLGR